MADEVLCLDTSVLVKFLTAEEPPEQADAAARLVLRGLTGARLVAPAFAWAEVGSVLLKKARRELLSPEQAAELWTRCLALPVDYVDSPGLRSRAWELVEAHGLATLYDAAFLACAELAPADEPAVREFWTADALLVQRLGERRPSYVHLVAE